MDIDQQERSIRHLLELADAIGPGLELMARRFAKRELEEKDAEIDRLKSEVETFKAARDGLESTIEIRSKELAEAKSRVEELTAERDDAAKAAADIQAKLDEVMAAPKEPDAPAPVAEQPTPPPAPEPQPAPAADDVRNGAAAGAGQGGQFDPVRDPDPLTQEKNLAAAEKVSEQTAIDGAPPQAPQEAVQPPPADPATKDAPKG